MNTGARLKVLCRVPPFIRVRRNLTGWGDSVKPLQSATESRFWLEFGPGFPDGWACPIIKEFFAPP
jgi:hypothetical protein